MILIANVDFVTLWSKPRASGDDPSSTTRPSLLSGVNPARAGMILAIGVPYIWGGCKPRASGDDPRWKASMHAEPS